MVVQLGHRPPKLRCLSSPLSDWSSTRDQGPIVSSSEHLRVFQNTKLFDVNIIAPWTYKAVWLLFPRLSVHTGNILKTVEDLKHAQLVVPTIE